MPISERDPRAFPPTHRRNRTDEEAVKIFDIVNNLIVCSNLQRFHCGIH